MGIDSDTIVDISKLTENELAMQAYNENLECLGIEYDIDPASIEIIYVEGRYATCGEGIITIACANPGVIIIGFLAYENGEVTLSVLKHELGHIMTGQYNHNPPLYNGVQSIFICNALEVFNE